MKATSIVIVFLVSIIQGCVSNENNVVHAGKYDKSLPINSFQYTGNWIACISDTADELACHRIGNIKVGSDYAPSMPSSQDIEQANGVTASVFPIFKNEIQEAYFVIGHKDKKIVSIQLTGNYPSKEMSFSSIMLGDSKEKVEKILGPKHTKIPFKDGGISGDLWDYYPFQFSFEFVNEKVYSIMVTK